MIEFTRWWVLLLLPLPLLARYTLPPLPANRAVVLPDGVLQALSSAAARYSSGASRLSVGSIAAVIGWLALLFALAQPVMRVDELPWRSGQSIVVAVDLSASMGQVSGQTSGESRYQTVSTIVSDFIAQRKGDRVALIVFANDAYLVSPFTYDVNAVIDVLSELNIGLPGRKTDLGQPIGLAVKLIRDELDNNSIDRNSDSVINGRAGSSADIADTEVGTTMLIVTDGETNTGQLSAIDASELAKQLGMTVHVIGFSSAVKPESQSYMREVAELTGGQYAEAHNSTRLQQVYSALADDSGARQRHASDTPQSLFKDFTWLPLLLALLSLLFYSQRARSEQ